jgi:CBS domain-containing protein
MKLKDPCVLEVASCTPELTIADAARLMRQHHTGDLVVLDNADEEREPVGIITDRDMIDDERCVLGIVTLDDMLRVHAAQANRLLDIVGKEQVREQRTRR